MSSSEISLQSPLPRRFKAWMDERFPLKNSILSILMYASIALVARASTTADGPLVLGLVDAAGCVVVFSLFLLLRVFDEHKDYALDLSNHPQRVLSRGLITLNHLKVAGALSILAQVLFSVAMDGGVGGASLAWLVMFIWICLMGVEFFCGEWLEKRLTLYAFSHMLVMFLIGWWAAELAADDVPLNMQTVALLLMLFVGGFSFEITRKTRGPEEERDTVDSYTRIFGVKGAAAIVVALVTLLAVTQITVVVGFGGMFWAGFAIIAIAHLLTVRQLMQFAKAPSLAMREKNEATVGLFMLIGFAVVIAAACVARGIKFSFF